MLQNKTQAHMKRARPKGQYSMEMNKGEQHVTIKKQFKNT